MSVPKPNAHAYSEKVHELEAKLYEHAHADSFRQPEQRQQSTGRGGDQGIAANIAGAFYIQACSYSSAHSLFAFPATMLTAGHEVKRNHWLIAGEPATLVYHCKQEESWAARKHKALLI
ncbi:hypothetical protein N2152v2_004534 [Parachlorella kessleri]